MTDEERELVERWIITFCETPPVTDVELMRRLIAEQQATPQGVPPASQDLQDRRPRKVGSQPGRIRRPGGQDDHRRNPHQGAQGGGVVR